MKTPFLLFIFLPLFIFSAHAQDNKASKISTGFEAAVRSSQQLFDSDTNIESENQNGFSLSGTLFIDVNAWYQIKTGLSFNYYKIQERDFSPLFGCDMTSSGAIDSRQSFYALDYRFLYLGIPVESKFKLFGETNHFYAKAGFELLFNTSSEGSTSLHECGTSVSELTNPIFSPNSFVLSTELGLGYELLVAKKTKIYFEPLVELWLNKIFKKQSSIISEDVINNSRLLSFGLAAGVRF